MLTLPSWLSHMPHPLSPQGLLLLLLLWRTVWLPCCPLSVGALISLQREPSWDKATPHLVVILSPSFIFTTALDDSQSICFIVSLLHSCELTAHADTWVSERRVLVRGYLLGWQISSLLVAAESSQTQRVSSFLWRGNDPRILPSFGRLEFGN